MHNKKPRGSLNYANVDRPSMELDRMDSLRSMKNTMDPFIRTNKALLKRVDSISTLFNKDGSSNIHNKIAIQETNHYFNNFHSGVSQTSARFGPRNTPIFHAEGVSDNDISEMDNRKSEVGIWDNSRGSTVLMNGSQSPKKKISNPLQNVINMKEPFIKSDISAVSVNEIMDFEDYIPFRPTYNLESIDEEKQMGLDLDLEEMKSITHELKKNEYSFKEARMSEEESFDSDENESESSKVSQVSSEESSEDESEYKDYLKVEAHLMPRKSSTFNSSQLNDRSLKFNTKISLKYKRQGTGDSELTMGNYSQKRGI